MSSERTKEERRSAVLLPNNLALPNANCLVIHQSTIRIVLSTKRSKQLFQQLCVVRPRNSTLPIFLYVIPVLNLIFKRNPPLLGKVPHRLEESSKNTLFNALKNRELKHGWRK